MAKRGLLFIVAIIALIVATSAAVIFLRRSPPRLVNKTVSTRTATELKANPATQSKYFYPIRRYGERIKIRRFGQFLTVKDVASVPCGAEFTGFHTGDDLEVFFDELNANVPVYAVAYGTVEGAEYTAGYGGLLILVASLSGSPVTIYYGHIDLNSLRVRRGDAVKPGQILSNLGMACSAQTNGERKHLHFAIHLGTGVDVRGYVPTKGELSAWVNPSKELSELGASNPGD